MELFGDITILSPPSPTICFLEFAATKSNRLKDILLSQQLKMNAPNQLCHIAKSSPIYGTLWTKHIFHLAIFNKVYRYLLLSNECFFLLQKKHFDNLVLVL